MIRRLLAGAKALVASHPAVVATTIALGIAGTTVIAVSGDSDNGRPAAVVGTGSSPRDDLVVRALGDSVTAGFGYYADGSPVPASEIVGGIPEELFGGGRCLPPSPPDGRCQSPKTTAFPAVFAQRVRVPIRRPNFDNLAVSGSTPSDWLAGPFAGELGQVVADDPDLTVLTLGANPLLQTFLAGRGGICARSPFAQRCVDAQIRKNNVRQRVADVLERLLDTPDSGRNGEVVVFTYHEAQPLPAYGSRVTILLNSLNVAIAEAVETAKAARPDDADRLILVDPPSFADHQCDDDEPWVLLTDSCIHPNALGHQKLADALLDAVDDRLPERESAVAQPETPADSDEFLIDVDDQGQVARVGAFEPAQYLGAQDLEEGDPGAGVAPTLGNAIAAYGQPASRGELPGTPGCTVEWPDLSLIAISQNYSDYRKTCVEDAGVVEITITAEGGERWSTNRGLRVGDSDARLRGLYPQAYVSPHAEHTYVLLEEPSPIGDTGKITRLSAGVFDTRVSSITVHLYGAGE